MRTTPPPPIDIAQIFPELAGKAKTTVRLHPRRGPEPGIRESKMGGLFLWPTDEPWPVCDVPEYPLLEDELVVSEDGNVELIFKENLDHNDYYVGILQIRAGDAPELVFPEGKDLFQLLWCPRDHQNTFAPVCKVYWRKAEDIKNPLSHSPSPSHVEETYVPYPYRLDPERVTEYPSLYELSNGLVKKILKWQGNEDRLYEFQFSTAPGTKIGGYIEWLQLPKVPICDCGSVMEHLLTVSSCEWDCGTFQRWCPLEDREENVSDEEFDDEHDFRISRDGSLYLFICRQCKDWPIKWILQAG